jgi:hypothetical protein
LEEYAAQFKQPPIEDDVYERIKNRVFKWYEIKTNQLPENAELVHFDDKKSIMHLGRYYKEDQWGRNDVFVTTEGAYFTKDLVDAWIPVPPRFGTINFPILPPQADRGSDMLKCTKNPNTCENPFCNWDKCLTEEKLSAGSDAEAAANDFAYSQQPSCSPNDAIYYTKGDRWDDIYDSFIAGAKWAKGSDDCEANHLDINELLKEFNRRGFDTSNWDGDEGAEKAIVDGVCNSFDERTDKLFDTITEQHMEINRLKGSDGLRANQVINNKENI